MKYTKDNIEGIQFRTGNNKNLYTIRKGKLDYKVVWNDEKDFTHYDVETLLRLLNQKQWIPLNTINKFNHYAIY